MSDDIREALTAEDVEAVATDPDAAREFLGTDAGKAVLQDALGAAETRREQAQVTEKSRTDFEASLREAQASGDFSSFGEMMAGKMAEAQQASAVNEAVGEGVNAELQDTIAEVYGDTIKSLGEEGAKKLDAMSLPDAIKALNEIQSRAASTSKPIPASGDSEWNPEKARAITEQGIAEGEQEEADWAGVRESVRKQLADMEA